MRVEVQPKNQRELEGEQAAPSIIGLVSRLTGFREFMILAIVVAACIVMWVIAPIFMTFANWSALLLQVSLECIVAIGMTILLVSGGFDLSVGSTFGLAGAVTAMAIVSGVPEVIALLLGLATGTVIGLVNGFIIARIGINPFVTTLAMMSMVRGLLLVITRGRNIAGLPEAFGVLGQGNLFGIQNPIWISASVTAGTGLELKVITAVIIGGASLKGGEGTILGSFLGSLLMGILVGALTILGVDVYWNSSIIGATLLLAVLIDTLGRYRVKRSS